MIEQLPLGYLKINPANKEELINNISKNIIDHNKSYCIPLNLSKYIMAKKDAKLREVILRADMVIADGIAIVWLCKRAGYRHITKIAGIDLAEDVLAQAKENNWRLFFLGASPENINLCINNIAKQYNGICIAGSHHGYFRNEEVPRIRDLINSSNANILLVGMGLPQKEYFIHDYFSKLNVNFALTVGGAFDMWAGKKKRTPQVFQKMGIEWLARSIYD